MRRNIFLIILLFLSAQYVKSADLSERADSAYTADNFEEAALLYQEIINNSGNSAILQYNLGNCYYRLGEPGKAILCYERALRLDPRFEEARTNLAFVNTKIIDRPGERGSFMSNIFDKTANTMRSNVWGWIGLGLFACFIISLSLYFLTNIITLRKIGFFGGIVFIFLTLGALILAFRSRQISIYPNFGIITRSSTILSTSPREPKDRNEEAMLLHEGTKVEIIDSVTTKVDSISVRWYEVQVDNSHRAWIKSTELEKI